MASPELRNTDWLRSAQWSLTEGDYPVESVQQLLTWGADNLPGDNDGAILTYLVHLPAFEAAPETLREEVMEALQMSLAQQDDDTFQPK